MNQRIALINTPDLPTNIKITPNLGLVSVATALRNQNYDADIIDLCYIDNPEKVIEDVASKYSYFGFSSTSAQFYYAYNLHKILKELNPNATTFIGGSHASAISAIKRTTSASNNEPNIQALEKFDIIFEGEAESKDFGNELFTEGPKWRALPIIPNLDDLLIPNRSLIDINSYIYYINGRRTTMIMTQRGCPFSCIFCGGRKVKMYNKVRSRFPKKVLEEMDFLNKEFGYNSFRWFDDEVNINSKRLFELSRLLQKRNYVHRGFVRSDIIQKNPDTVKALKDAGFVELLSGIESGSNEVLERIRKGTTYEINQEAAFLIKDLDIQYKAFIMIGHPGETSKDIEKTIQWIQETQPDGLEVFITTPLPGAVIYNESVPSTKYDGFSREYKGLYFNQLDYSQKQQFHNVNPSEYVCEVRTDELTSEDLIQIRNGIEQKFKRMKKSPFGLDSPQDTEFREKI